MLFFHHVILSYYFLGPQLCCFVDSLSLESLLRSYYDGLFFASFLIYFFTKNHYLLIVVVCWKFACALIVGS